ncbi:MAG: outer membrane lipoprotein-sorting protein [Bradymonadia bacterium]|jgi:outer membrane lipoprotein-sorting protein
MDPTPPFFSRFIAIESAGFRILQSAFFALSVAALVACGGRQTPPPADAVEDPVVLFEAVLSRLEAVESARLRATLEYYGDSGRVRVEQVVLARQPGDVRIETLSPFGPTLAVFVANDSMLSFYDAQAEDFYTGAPSQANIARLLPMRLTQGDIVRVLLGAPPLDAVNGDPHTYTVEWDRERAAYHMRMPLADGTGDLQVWIRHGTWTMTAAERGGRDGFLLLTGRLETHDVDGFETEMPQRIEFEMPEQDVDISLDVERIELNPTLSDALFELRAPRSATVIDL